MSDAADTANFDKNRAELFDALGHPVRISILVALEDGPLGFSELRRKVGLESGGHLQFHLGKLDGLIKTGEDGNYDLTDDGREALRIVSAHAGFHNASEEARGKNKIVISRAVMAALVAAIVLLSSVALYQGLELTNGPHSISTQILPLLITSDFNSSVLQVVVTPLTPVVSQGQNVTIGVEVFNPLEYGLQATGYLSGTSLNPCSSLSPVDAEVYFGYYTLENVSGASPLVLNPVGACNILTNSVNYTFYPHSDTALASPPPYNTFTATEVRGVFSFSGFYNSTSCSLLGCPSTSFSSLASGTYTVLASDIWGHQALCYFYVTTDVSPTVG